MKDTEQTGPPGDTAHLPIGCDPFQLLITVVALAFALAHNPPWIMVPVALVVLAVMIWPETPEPPDVLPVPECAGSSDPAACFDCRGCRGWEGEGKGKGKGSQP